VNLKVLKLLLNLPFAVISLSVGNGYTVEYRCTVYSFACTSKVVYFDTVFALKEDFHAAGGGIRCSSFFCAENSN
jgi:hypothetical protein